MPLLDFQQVRVRALQLRTAQFAMFRGCSASREAAQYGKGIFRLRVGGGVSHVDRVREGCRVIVSWLTLYVCHPERSEGPVFVWGAKNSRV